MGLLNNNYRVKVKVTGYQGIVYYAKEGKCVMLAKCEVQ